MKKLSLLLSVFFVSNLLQASESSVLNEESYINLDHAFKKCQLAVFGIGGKDVSEAALRGIALAREEEQRVVISTIARHNIDRMTFSGLATEDAVTINSVQYKRPGGVSKEQFAKDMPRAAALISRMKYGLMLDQVEDKKGVYEITYNYYSLTHNSNFKLVVQASYSPEVVALKTKMKQFADCIAYVQAHPCLTIDLPEFDVTKCEGIEETLTKHKAMFNKGFENLLQIYKEKDQSEDKRRFYTIYAWQLFSFKRGIEEGANTLHRMITEGSNPGVFDLVFSNYQRHMRLIDCKMNDLYAVRTRQGEWPNTYCFMQDWNQILYLKTELGW